MLQPKGATRRIRFALLCFAVALSISSSQSSRAADASAPFGNYPDCIAPAIPMEVHSWWGELGDEHPRHLHMATCLPNARDTDGSLVSVSRAQPFSVRVTSFNNPGRITSARWSWESDIKEKVPVDFQCQTSPMEMRECHWWVDMTLDPALSSSGGLREMRLTPNIPNNDLGARQFATLNYQIFLKNGRGESNYRSRPDPIGRSWYTDFDYANVSVNYTDFFRGAADLNKTMPTVSGVVPLRIRHQRGSHAVRSQLWQDVDFHHDPEFWKEAVVGVPNAEGAKLLYSKPGRFDGTYEWDTLGLANGVHVLYFETVDESPDSFNAGALKLFLRVENGGSTPPPPPPGPGTPPPAPEPLVQALSDVQSISSAALAGQEDRATALRRILERARTALGL
jgi:hypothetical protein